MYRISESDQCHPSDAHTPHRNAAHLGASSLGSTERHMQYTDIRRNNQAREMRSLRLCTYHVPKKRSAGVVRKELVLYVRRSRMLLGEMRSLRLCTYHVPKKKSAGVVRELVRRSGLLLRRNSNWYTQ